MQALRKHGEETSTCKQRKCINVLVVSAKLTQKGYSESALNNNMYYCQHYNGLIYILSHASNNCSVLSLNLSFP